MANRKGKQGLTDADADALAELGMTAEPETKVTYTPKQERIIAGFEEVQRFVREYGRLPQHGEGNDIFERLYAVRLDRMRQLAECRDVLEPLDTDGLLDGAEFSDTELTEEQALAELGVATGEDDITTIRNVRRSSERNSPDEVARRKPCEDFERFAAAFEAVQQDLSLGGRKTIPFKGRDDQAIATGDWFILDGQKVYVASASEPFMQEYGEKDRRLRVIYDNGQESDLLMRSLRRALNKDEASRRILDAEAGPLFSDQADLDDVEVGSIYVVRSQSDDPFVAEHRQTLHKIGVTSGAVKKRLANARKDPTFLLAGVEVVAEYTLMNVDRVKVENLLHRFFEPARMDVRLKDRFGEDVEPREWFLVPLPEIKRAVELLMSGEIMRCRYDPTQARVVCPDSDDVAGNKA
jgi:Meiotically up-regulated gene 113